jgi:copper transport protein
MDGLAPSARRRSASARIRLLLAAVLAVTASWLPASPAFAHAAFVGSQPGPGAQLDTAPQRVVLSFTEPLNGRLSRARIVRVGDGRIVPLEAQAASERRIVLRPRGQLDTRAYRVEWHTVSTEDGHALEGAFSFGVRAPAAGGEHELEQSPLARAGWIRVSLRALLYVALLPFAAGLLVPALLRSQRPSWLVPRSLDACPDLDAAPIRTRERRIVADLGWLAVLAAIAATLAEAGDAAGGLAVAGLRDFLLSNAAGAARVGAVLALIIAALLAQRGRGPAGVLVALALLGIAASGHASSAAPRGPSVLNDWLHLLAGAVWLGGIALIVVVWAPVLRRGRRAARDAVARHVLPGFGRVALPAFLFAAATGVVSLLIQLGHLNALWETAYGRVLLVKIGLVGLIGAASALHAWYLRPRLLAPEPPAPASVERRHWRLVRSEPFLGLGVAAAVALLVAFPLPPRQLAEAGEVAAPGQACSPCAQPEPRTDELAVADQAGSQVVAGWLRRDGERVSGAVRVLDVQGRPSPAPFRVLGARQRACGRGCRRFSRRAVPEIRVAVRERGRRDVATLPAVWEENHNGEARAVLRRAQAAMRGLRSVREVEELTSGPGSYARTEYRLVAPDRMALTTNLRAHTVIVGERQWFRTAHTPWRRTSYGSGIPFSVRRWFRWTTYATAVRLLDRRRDDARRVIELALMDPATPVWLRLVVDERTGWVVRERMVARAHFMTSRYSDFNAPLRVEVPRVG